MFPRAALLLGCSVFLMGQAQTQPSTNTASLAGRVLEAGSQTPLRRASVTLNPARGGAGGANRATTGGTTGMQSSGTQTMTPSAGQRYQVMTDDEGRFVSTQMAAGRYMILAEKTGYVSAMFRRGTAVDLASGQARTGIDVELQKQGVIAGRVVDADGEPVERAMVQAITASAARNGRGGGSTTTDDRGEFRISKLPPGRYKVVATRGGRGFFGPGGGPGGPGGFGRGGLNPSAAAATSNEPRMIEAPTYYPAALDIASAGEIPISPGDEKSGVEIRLQKSTAVRVSGQVTGAMPAEGRLSVMLAPGGTSGPPRFMGGGGGQSPVAKDGTFTFANVRPGEYNVVASAFGRNGGGVYGKTTLSVGQNDITGVNLPLAPPMQVTGRIRTAGDPPFTLSQVNLTLQPAEFAMSGPIRTQSQADGTFTFENVSRQKMNISASAPSGTFLQTVLAGSQPLPTLEIDFNVISGPIELVFSNKPAKIEGTVEGITENTVAVVVYAMPLTPEGTVAQSAGMFGNQGINQVRVAEGTNTFTLENLRPGAYRIAAAESLETDILTDPVLWERFRNRAGEVRVAEGESGKATLKLILANEITAN